MRDNMIAKPELRLTDDELNEAWDNALETPINFDRDLTPRVIFTIALRAVAEAQLAKVRNYYL